MIIKLLYFIIFTYLHHPIHLGITEINYNQSDLSLEIIHKFFIDDIEKAIEQEFDTVVHLGTEKEFSNVDIYIQAYLKKYFQLKINKKSRLCSYVGKENDLQWIWIYQEILNVKKLKYLTVYHTSIMNLHEDQQNMIHFSKNKKQQLSILLNKNKPSKNIQIQ